jgi:hypothetical protein
MSYYFRNLPNFEYTNRNPGGDNKNLDNYVEIKNIFRRGKIREDILGNLMFFTRYSIVGDERPDNVAYKEYGDSKLDWIVLLSNNILNVHSEWPLKQTVFDSIMLEKYGSYEELYNGVHHYETVEIRNTLDVVIMNEGIKVPENFTITYFDPGRGEEMISEGVARPVTYFEEETRKEEAKRNILLLKKKYLGVVFDDIEREMAYKKGSTQFVSRTLKRADGIRLFE